MQRLAHGVIELTMQAPIQLHTKPLFTQFILFCSKALVLLLCTYWIAQEFVSAPLWFVVSSVFLFSIPISLSGIYSSTIHQIRRLTFFAKRGLIFRVLSGRPLKVFFWVCWALASSFFMLIQFHSYDTWEWISFIMVIPVFWIIFILSRRLISAELKSYLVTDMALIWSRRLTPIFMFAVYISLAGHFADTPAYSSLKEAIGAQIITPTDMTGSSLVREASRYLVIYDGAKEYAIGRMGAQDSLFAVVFLAIGKLLVFFNTCVILSSFLLTRQDFRRLFGTLSDADIAPPVPLSRIAIIAGTTTFISLFILLPMSAYLEAWIQETPEVVQARQTFELQVEKIDDVFFKKGTLEKIHKAKIAALHDVDMSFVRLETQAERAFDKMESNVDIYLDWYYSLAGEYTRIGALLLGKLESQMTSKLTQVLQKGNAFAAVETEINSALSVHQSSQNQYHQSRESIMQENRIDLAESPYRVVQAVSLEELLKPPVHQDIINLQKRLAASGGAGTVVAAVTAVVAKKIVAKAVGKNILKLAAKALLKTVTSKTFAAGGGALAGATGGALVGSVVPGIGTAIGATIGGIIGGLTVGVSVDKLLLMLEESMNRTEFQARLISVIEESRLEFMQWIDG